MSSLRMRIMGALMRPVVRSLLTHAQDPLRLRDLFERAARINFRLPPFSLFLPDRYGDAPHQTALWVSNRPRDTRQVLLYLHGGGYIVGSPDTHKKLVARLCRMTGLRAFLPAYRLAPEHPVPAALEDAQAAHADLIRRGYAPGDIVIGGDSAGGGLALALLAQLCQEGLQPAAAFAWSPFADQTFSGGSVVENGKRDHFFPGDRVQFLADMILGGTKADDPRASPLFAAFPDCPPVLLQVSDSEILRDDALRMEEKLRETGGEVRLEMWPDAPHVWQLFDGWFPEAREAIGNTARFLVGRRFSDTETGSGFVPNSGRTDGDG